MGKIRFKLSHVMPHVWFYKLREVSKIGESHAYGSSQSKPVSSRKVTYTSPVNHKAIDIPFPVETPKRSPLIEAPLTFPEGIAVLSPLHSVEISADNWPLTNLPSTLNHHLNMDNYAEEDYFHGLSSAPKSKSGVVNSGFTFDVRELEIRLKALGSEDRRKYYTSPMFSDALPSPILDATHTAASHAESFDMQEYSSVDVHGGENRRFPLKVVYEEGKPFDRGGGGFYRSSNESNSLRQSTSSSSDTGFERGSSSVWERDVFSITSDGSEAFTTADDVDSNPMMQRSSRQHHRNPKEKVNTAQNSPLPYASSHDFATIHNDISIGFYIGHHRDIAAVQKDMVNGFNCETEAMQSDINSALYGHNCDIAALAHGDSNRSGWSTYKSNDRPSSKASPSNSVDSQQGIRHAANFANKYQAVVNQGKEPPFLDYEGINQLPLVQYESSDDQKSQHRKVFSSEFSYMGCKERLLSGRMSFDQCSDTAASESKLETISNYTKFKLKKKGNTHSKMSIIGSLSPDLDLYNKLSSNKQSNNMDQEAYANGYANGMSSRFDSEGNPAHFKGSSRRNSVDHSRSPYQKGLMGDIKSNTTYDEGPASWFKATRRAVREKTRDPSFQHFSLKPGAAQSRVFDSFAMVKCSYDPKQDFKESMVEMILEKDLYSSHDMVELLQCYLTLNSENYHDTIVKVFTEVWSEVCQHV